MIERHAGGWRVTVPMVMDNARALFAAGEDAIDGSFAVIDLDGIPEANSSSLAVLMGWLRTAQTRGGCVSFRNAPPGVRALVGLYDLDGILPLA